MQKGSAVCTMGISSVILMDLMPIYSDFSSLLLIFVEPNGPGYEIQLQGCVDVPNPATTMTNQDAVILSNKSFLSWGGVATGQTMYVC